MAVAVPQQTLESFNPTTGELIGSVPTLRPEDVQGVVDEVAQVQPFWAQLPLAERGRYLRRAAQVILDEIDDIRDLIAREQGKPRTEAYMMEILPTVDALHWIAEAGRSILADEKVRFAAALLQDRSARVRLRAARRGRRDRAVELPVDDPAGRGGDRAHGGQRRRAQAGLADLPDRSAHPGGLRARGSARGDRPRHPRRRGGRPGPGRVQRGQGLLHRFGGGGARRRRGVRAS